MEQNGGGGPHNHFMQSGNSSAFTAASASGYQGLYHGSSAVQSSPTPSYVTIPQGSGISSASSSLQQLPGYSGMAISSDPTSFEEHQPEVEVLHDMTLQAATSSSAVLGSAGVNLTTNVPASNNGAGGSRLPGNVAGSAQDAGYCIVCATVQNNLAVHMQAHSKEEMISALMGGSSTTPQSVSSTSVMPQSSPMALTSAAQVTSRVTSGKITAPIMSTLPMISPTARTVSFVGCGPSGIGTQQQANSIPNLGTAGCQAVSGSLISPRNIATNSGILLSSVRPTQLQHQQQIISKNNFLLPNHPPPSYQPQTSATSTTQYAFNNDMNVVNSGNTFLSNTKHSTASTNRSPCNQNYLNQSNFGATPNQVTNQSIGSLIGSQSFLIPQNANIAQTPQPVLNYSICSQSTNATVVGQPIANSGSNIPNVNALPYTHQVPLLLMPNCAMPLMQPQSPKIEIKTDECPIDGAGPSSNNQRYMQSPPNLQQVRHTQQVQFVQPQTQQIRMYQQQQTFSQQQQMLTQQHSSLFSQPPQLFNHQQQQVQPQQAVVSQSSLTGAKLLLLGSNNVMSPLGANNRGFVLTNNRLQSATRPPEVSSCSGITNNMLYQNVNNRTLSYISNKNVTNNIQGPIGASVSPNISSLPGLQQTSLTNSKTLLLSLPKPPSYQTAVKNSLLVNNLSVNARTSSSNTASRSLSTAGASSSGCSGVTERFSAHSSSNDDSFASHGQQDITNNDPRPVDASKTIDSDNITTIQVGNNITIAVPKDVADKRERLQQIINEELVRGILLNDCKDPIRDAPVTKDELVQGCSSIPTNTLLAKTNSGSSCSNGAGSTSHEMKVELFEEICGSESVNPLEGKQRMQHQGSKFSVGKSSNNCTAAQSADASFNVIEEEEEEGEESFVEDGLRYSEDQKSSVQQHLQMGPLEDEVQSNDSTCVIVDRSQAVSEKIYVTEAGLCQPGPSRVNLPSYQMSHANSGVMDPLSIQSQDVCNPNDRPQPFGSSQSVHQRAREVRNSMLGVGESCSSKRSPRSSLDTGSGRQSVFATTFTDLIKKDFTSDNAVDDAGRRRGPSETTFSSGSSSFKVVGINELDQDKEQAYLPLEVKVKQDEICVVEDESLFSPSSVISSGTAASEHSSASDHSIVSEHATSSRGSSSRRHEEDLSLRAAETLADSDSEHAVHDCRMEAPESLANLLANLSEESNVSENHHPAMEGVSHGTSSTSWLPVRQYSPKHFTRSRHSPSREDCHSPTDSQSPIDLRHSPRHGGRSATSAPATSLPYPLHFHYHGQGLDFHSTANVSAPSHSVTTVAASGSSLQQQQVVSTCGNSGQVHVDTGNSVRNMTVPGASDAPAHHSSFGSPIVNSDGVVLNLDSCTVMPQTLNFAHLFSPPHSSGAATTPDHPYHKCMTSSSSNAAGPSSSSCAPDDGSTNGIYLATSEIMRNISSYLGSPSSASKDNLQGATAGGSHEEGLGAMVGFSQSGAGGSNVIGGLESSFSMANEFNMSFDDPVLASIASRKTPSRHESPRKAFPSPRMLGSPEPSTSGLSRAPPSLHEPDYEFDYDSDGYADSDNELHGRSSLPLEQWRCHVCNKMFKSLKEKLLHAGQHSPRCVVPGDVTAARFRSVTTDAKDDQGPSEILGTREVKCEEMKVFVQVKGEDLEMDSSDLGNLIDRQESTGDDEDTEALREAKSKEALKTIEACRTETQEYKCPECSSIFVNPEDLLVHRKRALGSKHICPFCHEEFENNYSKGHHMKSVHSDKQFSCPFCYVTYKSMYTWCRHQLYHLGIVLFECKCCGRRFNRKFEYEQHQRVHTGERPFSCPQCEKCFANENNLRRHLLTHLEGQELKCEVCSKMYKNWRTLSKHRANAHPQNGKKTKIHRDFICSVENCGKIYASAKKLAWHQETHQRWPKRCEFCKERFIHTSNLVKHIRMKHNAQYMEEKEGNKSCPICFKVFLKSSLGQHMRIHSGVKPFKCYMCSKSFRVKCNLEAHMYVHSGKRDRPFKCTLCVRSFCRQKDLEAHIRSHKNIRPFTCNECGKSFIHKNNLSMHMAQHSGRKDFKCAQCGKAFFRKYNLQNHERVHTGQAPFTCPICLKTFTQKSNYNVHKKSFHVDRHTVHEEL